MQEDYTDNVSDEETLKEQRMEAIEDLQDILHEAEEHFGHKMGHVRRSINIAKDRTLDDEEYAGYVQLALIQLNEASANIEAVPSDISKQSKRFKKKFEAKAAVPSQYIY